ncbi:MAG: spore germination protein [Bacillota bacterium]
MNKFDKILKIGGKIFSPETMVVTRQFTTIKGNRCVIYFSDGMVDKNSINDFVIRPISRGDFKISADVIAGSVIDFAEFKTSGNFFEFVSPVFGGEALLAIEGVDKYFSLNTRFWPTRGVSEPPTDMVIKGPREGFNEDFQTCITLIKRRIKSPNLKFEAMKIGKYSQTNVALCYVSRVASKSLISAVRNKLENINIDGVIDSSYLKQFLKDSKFSVIRGVGDTEKPDILASRLLEGRVAIIVDGSPIVLTLPYVFLEDLQAPQDYYDVPHSASFSRILRLASMLVALFAPGVYVASQLFHNQFIPLSLLLKIAGESASLPLSPPLEMLVTLFIFEILNQASLRMPKYVGMALSVVGALVLGDTAVQAGLISTPTILIVAISGIGAYTIPDQQSTISILRLAILLVGGVFGIVGIFCFAVALAVYISGESSFGVSLLAPFSARSNGDIDDGILKMPSNPRKNRPKIFSSPNKTRVGETVGESEKGDKEEKSENKNDNKSENKKQKSGGK